MLAIPKVIAKWYPLLIIIILFLLTDFPRKLKLEKFHGAFIIHFYVSQSSPPLQSSFKENAKIFAKNSTPQENITTSRQDLLFFIKSPHKKKNTLVQATCGKIPDLVLKLVFIIFYQIFIFSQNDSPSKTLKSDFSFI